MIIVGLIGSKIQSKIVVFCVIYVYFWVYYKKSLEIVNHKYPNPMAPLKIKFLNSYNSCILFILSLLGFSTSCKEDNYVWMYGSPHATFRVVGEVKSAINGKPIPEIIIEVRKEYNEETGLVVNMVETGFSEDTGKYTVSMGDWPDDQTYHLRFSDTDGALNGEFEPLDTTVVFKDPKFTNGDGSWYSGVAEQELNIKLKPKK